MALIEIQGLTTLFGSQPLQVLQQVRAGMDKATLLRRTGHTLKEGRRAGWTDSEGVVED